jgi:hypothetical protein
MGARLCAVALLLWAPLARSQDISSCFSGAEMENFDSAPTPVTPGEAQAVAGAFAKVTSYRACISMASLFSGSSRGLLEVQGPDRWHWQSTRQPRRGPAVSVEAVRIGTQTWFRSGSGSAWKSLASGRELSDAAPGAALPPTPRKLLDGFLKDVSALVKVGGARSRSGPCVTWEQPTAPGGIRQAFCFGPKDHLPYRHAAGGPVVEAYLQIEFYDFGQPVAVEPPR